MSLDFAVTAIKDFDKHFPNKIIGDGGREDWNDDITVLVWNLYHCEINSITEDNVGEVYTRMLLVNTLTPLFHRVDDNGERSEAYVVSVERIRLAVGLRTNVSGKTRHQWITGTFKRRVEDFEKEQQAIQ